jgi:hypothetical protein
MLTIFNEALAAVQNGGGLNKTGFSCECATTSVLKPEAGFLVRVHPDPCLILIRAQIHALLCASKSKFIPA